MGQAFSTKRKVHKLLLGRILTDKHSSSNAGGSRSRERSTNKYTVRILWHLFGNRGQVMTEAYEAMGIMAEISTFTV